MASFLFFCFTLRNNDLHILSDGRCNIGGEGLPAEYIIPFSLNEDGISKNNMTNHM